MKKLLITLILLLSSTSLLAQGGSGPQGVRPVNSLPATCVATGSASSDAPVRYQGKVYICTATNTWTESGTGATVVDATETVAGKAILGAQAPVAFASLGTCAAGNRGQTKQLTDLNKGTRTCTLTTGSTYAWVDDDPRYDIRKFGCACDGSTNDTTAFLAAATAAVSAAAPLYVPPATCLLNTLTIPGALVIEGEGDISILKRHGTATDAAMLITADNLTLRKLKIDGNKSGVSGTRKATIQFTGGADSLLVENVDFTNTIGAAIYALDVDGKVTMRGGSITEMAEGDGTGSYPGVTLGIYVQGGTGELIVDNVRIANAAITTAARAPVGIQAVGDDRNNQLKVTIKNCTLEKMGSSAASSGAIDLYEYIRQPLIQGNKIFTPYYAAIKVVNSDDVLVDANIINGSVASVGPAAIFVSGSSRSRSGAPWNGVVVSNNVISGYDGIAAQLQGDNDTGIVSKNWTFANNTISASKYGVLVSNIGNAKISGGIITGITDSTTAGAAITVQNMPSRSLTIEGTRFVDNASYGIIAQTDVAGLSLIIEGAEFDGSTYDNIYLNAAAELIANGNKYLDTLRPLFANSATSVKLTNSRSVSGISAPSISASATVRHSNDFDSTTLTGIAGLSSAGLVARTAAATASARTITGTAGEVTVTDGDGVSGNPTLSIPGAIGFSATVTGNSASAYSFVQGNSYQWGHTNSEYRSVIGNYNNSGLPFLGFYSYHGATNNTLVRTSGTNVPSYFEFPIAGGFNYKIDAAGTAGTDMTTATTYLAVSPTTGVAIGDTGTATATAGAATLNTQRGVITSEALTTASGSTYALTITNSKVTTSSIVTASVQNGTNSVDNYYVQRITPGSGSVTIVIYNNSGGALNGTIKISFIVM